jgi:hypothetical protein
MKTCGRCHQSKPLDDFPLDGARGRYNYCRPCKAEYMRDYSARQGPDWHERRNLDRTCRRLGITVDDYDDMLRRQNGRCAICGATEPGGNHRRWPIDHDHDTGRVRGLLCAACNNGLGLFRDDVDALLAAVDYLRQSA